MYMYLYKKHLGGHIGFYANFRFSCDVDCVFMGVFRRQSSFRRLQSLFNFDKVTSTKRIEGSFN